MKKSFQGEGIKESQIENFNHYKYILESFICPICLDISKNPLQCKVCEALYCDECYEFLRSEGKGCVYFCKEDIIKKANKFVYDTLSKLKITCETCGKTDIEYNTYINHYEICRNIKYCLDDKIMSLLKEKRNQLESLKQNKLTIIDKETSLSEEEIKSKLITDNLSNESKLLLYNACIKGDLNEFINLIEIKKFPIFEEVSNKGYLWTSFHYSMHYGKENIIFYILDYAIKRNILEISLRLLSKDMRCPFQCLIKSNSLNHEEKKRIIQRIFNKYKENNIRDKISQEAMFEVKSRKYDD